VFRNVFKKGVVQGRLKVVVLKTVVPFWVPMDRDLGFVVFWGGELLGNFLIENIVLSCHSIYYITYSWMTKIVF
jgi:hypothetical protein